MEQWEHHAPMVGTATAHRPVNWGPCNVQETTWALLMTSVGVFGDLVVGPPRGPRGLVRLLRPLESLYVCTALLDVEAMTVDVVVLRTIQERTPPRSSTRVGVERGRWKTMRCRGSHGPSC